MFTAQGVLHTLHGALTSLVLVQMFFLFSYSWGAYCYSGFYMTSVEWSGSCETVEGGSELETVNTRITERQEHQEKVSYFPGSCPSGMDLSGEFGGHTPFGPTHTHGTRICILTTFR